MTRRGFLRTGGAMLAGAGLTGFYTWKIEPHWLEMVSHPLPMENLPPSWVGRTIAQISDLHVGGRVSDAYVLETFRRVNALAPDLVVFTGDFIDYHAGVWEQVARVYPSFPKGRLGTVAILGNHDYGPAWRQPEIADRLAGQLASLGLTILRNQVWEAEGLQIAGLDDLWANRFAGAKPAIASLDPRRATLVLTHNPDTVDHDVWADYRGWIFAGHTHGGQCKPPFLPPPLLPVENRRYTCGDFSLDGSRKMYISRGVGHLMQVRFNVRPEVTLHHLQAT